MGHPQSIIRSDHIEYGLWLAFDAEGGVRMTRKRPALSQSERAMLISVRLPRALFSTPELAARIDVAEPGDPVQIDIAAASAALEAAIGCQVELRVIEPAGD